MGWTLIVSENETFQREAIARLGSDEAVVGATGDSSARSLVRAIDVQRILIDAQDDVGRRFLQTLRMLPRTSFPDVEIVVVGDDATGAFPVLPPFTGTAGAIARSAA